MEYPEGPIEYPEGPYEVPQDLDIPDRLYRDEPPVRLYRDEPPVRLHPEYRLRAEAKEERLPLLV